MIAGRDRDMVLVSAIIPVYNGSRFLPRAIASIRAQGHPGLELILVNDGSTDESGAIIHATSDARRIHQPNGGIAAARNAGLQAATGDCIAWLDQDDEWAPDKLAHQLAALAADPALDFVLGHVKTELCDGEAPSWLRSRFLDATPPAYLFGAMLARRRCFDRIGGLDPAFRFGGDDVDWFGRAKLAGLKYAILDRVFLHRKIHDGNHSRFTREGNQELLQAMRLMVRRHREK